MIPLDPSPEPEPVMQGTVSSNVRERPILFSGEMVRAILDGRKTQTRRVLGVQPLEVLLPSDKRASSLARVTRKWDGQRVWFALTHRGERIEDNRGVAFRCKHGEVGDRLWVRETWGVHNIGWEIPPDPPQPFADIRYRADDALAENVRCPEAFYWPEESGGVDQRQRPSIFMPRWASRLTLEITDVRVERVQDISEADAKAEGVEREAWPDDVTDDDGELRREVGYFPPRSHIAAYARLWDSLNARRGYSWDSNPWVWVLSFRRCLTPSPFP